MAGRWTDGGFPGGSNRRNSHTGDDDGGCRHFLRRFGLEILAVAFFVAGGFCILSFNYSIFSTPYGSFSVDSVSVLRRLSPPANSPETAPSVSPEATHPDPGNINDPELIRILENAAMTASDQPTTSRGTVIITTVNDAWTEPESLLDIFLESFWVGHGTRGLVRHLVIVTMDQKAHKKCRAVHPHCYALTTPGVNFTGSADYFTSAYLQMMWRRLEFFGSVLGLGFDFIFSDADILWFRNPFPHFDKDVDFHVSADENKGNNTDRNNLPSCGFMFFRSNIRTLKFHKYWYESKFIFGDGIHDQMAFDKIKFDPFLDEIGLTIRFLDTDYFGGNCSPVRDLNVACTMHANCMVGLETKLNYLRKVLDDWKRFTTSNSSTGLESKNSTSFDWMRH